MNIGLAKKLSSIYCAKYPFADSADIFSIAMDTVWKCEEIFTGDGSLEAFVNYKFKFAIVDYLRKLKGRSERRRESKGSGARFVNLDTPDESGNTLSEVIPDNKPTPFQSVSRKDLLAHLPLHSLNEKERQVFISRFVDDKQMLEIANELGVTESRVCQIEQAVIKKLKRIKL